MASIFGASLGELLRHGSQFGLGVQEAGRQNKIAQQQAEAAQAKAMQEQMLAQALLEQRRASTDYDRGRLRSLGRPEPPKQPTEFTLSGGLKDILAGNPDASDQDVLDRYLNSNPDVMGANAREALSRIRRQQTQDTRAQEAAQRSEEAARRSQERETPSTPGGDDVGERQRVFAAASAIRDLEARRRPSDTPEDVRQYNRLRDQIFKIYNISGIEELQQKMLSFSGGQAPGAESPAPLEDPLGIR